MGTYTKPDGKELTTDIIGLRLSPEELVRLGALTAEGFQSTEASFSPTLENGQLAVDVGEGDFIVELVYGTRGYAGDPPRTVHIVNVGISWSRYNDPSIGTELHYMDRDRDIPDLLKQLILAVLKGQVPLGGWIKGTSTSRGEYEHPERGYGSYSPWRWQQHVLRSVLEDEYDGVPDDETPEFPDPPPEDL